MCIGKASGYIEPKEKLTVIHCENCGRSWQVTESEAKHYNEYYKGVCADCRTDEKKKQSLLKPYTNNDRINDMSIEEKAEFIGNGNCLFCVFHNIDCEDKNCKDGVKKWLESEAEENA